LRSLYRSWKARISEIVLGVFNRPHYVYPDCDPAFSYGVARFDQTQSTPAEDKTKLWVAHRPSVVLVKGNDEVSRPEGILISGTPIKLQAARGVFDSLNVEVTPGSEGLLLSGLPIPHKISVPSDLLPKEVRAALRELDLI